MLTSEAYSWCLLHRIDACHVSMQTFRFEQRSLLCAFGVLRVRLRSGAAKVLAVSHSRHLGLDLDLSCGRYVRDVGNLFDFAHILLMCSIIGLGCVGADMARLGLIQSPFAVFSGAQRLRAGEEYHELSSRHHLVARVCPTYELARHMNCR
jgi:hypothetical protein